MTEPKFTPGPWRWDRHGDLVTSDETELGIGWHTHVSAPAADMALIAAAPDLYMALFELLDYSGGASNALDDDYVTDRAFAALQKARGECEGTS